MVNICFALNENYLPYMCTLIYSILDNNRDINFKFFVINKDIDINFYDEFLSYLPYNNDIKIIDCKINQDSFEKGIQDQKIKNELKNLTNLAFEKNIFGAPTFVVNDKLFWGQDRLEYVLDEFYS